MPDTVASPSAWAWGRARVGVRVGVSVGARLCLIP